MDRSDNCFAAVGTTVYEYCAILGLCNDLAIVVREETIALDGREVVSGEERCTGVRRDAFDTPHLLFMRVKHSEREPVVCIFPISTGSEG